MTTPWDEARREALTAAEEAFHNSIFVVRGRIPGESSATHQIRHATNAYLSALSRLGYAIVPKHASREMQSAAARLAEDCRDRLADGRVCGREVWCEDGDTHQSQVWRAMANAGDVLRGIK